MASAPTPVGRRAPPSRRGLVPRVRADPAASSESRPSPAFNNAAGASGPAGDPRFAGRVGELSPPRGGSASWSFSRSGGLDAGPRIAGVARATTTPSRLLSRSRTKAPARVPADHRGGPDQRRSCPASAERGGVVDRRSTRRTAPNPRGPRARASPAVGARSPVTWPGCAPPRRRPGLPGVDSLLPRSVAGPRHPSLCPGRPYRVDLSDRPVPLALSKNRSAARDHEVGPARSPAHRPGLASGMSAPGGMRRGRDAHGAARPPPTGSPRAAASPCHPMRKGSSEDTQGNPRKSR